MSGWLTTAIEVQAQAEARKREQQIAQSLKKIRKIGLQLGLGDTDVRFVAEAGPILGDRIKDYFSIVEDVNGVLSKYDITLGQLMDMGNSLRGVLKDLIVIQSLPHNQEAVRRLRSLNAITLNLVENMKVSSELLAQLVVSLEGTKFQDLHQSDKESMYQTLVDIIDRLKNAGEIRVNTKKAKVLVDEIMPLVDKIMGYFKEKEVTKVEMLPPERATPGREVPYAPSPEVQEKLRSLDIPSSVQIIAEVSESDVEEIAQTVQELTAQMNGLADLMESTFEEFNPMFSQLVNRLSNAVTLVEGAGAEEAEAVSEPAMALASTKTLNNKKEKGEAR